MEMEERMKMETDEITLADALNVIYKFLDKCNVTTATLYTPDGTALSTDWGYFMEGMKELYDYALMLKESKNENSNVVKTYVRFCFASKRHRTISPEEYKCLCEAVKYASCNLYSRYRVKIDSPIMVKGYFNSYCVSELEIPNYLYSNFNIGNHLRGVSAYLLKNYPNHFKPLLVGKRLLFYVEWRKPDKEEEEKKND